MASEDKQSLLFKTSHPISPSRKMSRSRSSATKVYVGDLPRDASEKELGRVFDRYGNVRNVWVARNPPGFAFIEYEDPADAEDAVRDLDGT